MDNQINSLRVTIGEQIRLRRKELMITQPDLADIAGISINTLYKIERGQANPTIEVLGKILDVLGLEITVGVKQLNR
ncbi:helix-turn-helix domain-containing protein [Bacteroides thetaiotaomicron]|uniref:Helix-turn-helix transcriptional regulator n=2 Tax=Bacteroides TaxID=816 RepID=A0A6H0KWE9_9BACE|nr:helix-turn-helix domain-containing protein [Bacteroides faecium]MCA5996815.1 helix-turn-helix transcriptional regulator [Bacteroides thetaiotaomicron]MCA6023351.1 helix-turn-helix transcriptional regulator [Bacteroides thetaiotaomicron]QIU97499.1 helix-turn-helix transcriptional regulator [Bacteroides faecium]